jgi:phosphatidylserine/phosphatidylglycerophosphate/cardiolipin synthase-like enzyme
VWDDALTLQLLNAIACATTSLDIAVYDVTSPCLVDALLAARAANPDLLIRVVTEFDTCGRVEGTLVCELARLEEAGAAEVVVDNRPSYLMHDKFVIVDGARAVVTTANWTNEGLCGEYNAGLLLEDAPLVAALAAEFERFFVAQSFGPPDVVEPISSGGVDLYFSPSGADWQDELLRRVNNADVEIRFLVFAFTREDLAQAMVDAVARGVRVRGVIAHRFFTRTYDAVPLLVDGGVEVRVADVHHKTTLIEDSGGSTIVTGSGNLSAAARDNNNEVVVFIGGDDMWGDFDAEFDRIWAVAEVETLEEE